MRTFGSLLDWKSSVGDLLTKRSSQPDEDRVTLILAPSTRTALAHQRISTTQSHPSSPKPLLNSFSPCTRPSPASNPSSDSSPPSPSSSRSQPPYPSSSTRKHPQQSSSSAAPKCTSSLFLPRLSLPPIDASNPPQRTWPPLPPLPPQTRIRPHPLRPDSGPLLPLHLQHKTSLRLRHRKLAWPLRNRNLRTTASLSRHLGRDPTAAAKAIFADTTAPNYCFPPRPKDEEELQIPEEAQRGGCQSRRAEAAQSTAEIPDCGCFGEVVGAGECDVEFGV